MSGFYRTGRTNAARKIEASASPVVCQFVTERNLAEVIREEIDPFGIALSCINPAGHQPITSCGEIVCAHCSRIFWR